MKMRKSRSSVTVAGYLADDSLTGETPVPPVPRAGRLFFSPRRAQSDLATSWGVAPFQWHAGPLSCVWSEPCIGDAPITPLQGFCISARAIFPGRCPGLEYCALSGLKITFGSPCKGRLNEAQGNALRRGPGSRMISPERARYVRHDSKDCSRPVRIVRRFLPFVKASGGMGSRFRHGLGPRTVPPLKWSHTQFPGG